MNITNTQRNEAEHRDIWLQIPWYVNDRIDARQRRRVDAHLRDCDACRVELTQQRRVHESMSADTGVEQLPSASLNRLRQRLDAAAAPQQLDPHVDDAPAAARGAWRPTSRHALLAASVAVVAVALSVAVLASRHDATAPPDPYYTVTSAPQHPAQEVIRAVFAPATTLAQLQKILDESHLKIVAGPSEAGVYSLAMTRDQSVATALLRLRQHGDVRFAESSVPLPAREGR